MNKNILVIWEEVPERTRIFWLGGLNDKDYDVCLAAHGKTDGIDGEGDEPQALYNLLFDTAGKPRSNHKLVYDTNSNKVSFPFYFSEPATVIVSGQMM